jgi:hypothetical protein
MRIRLTAILVLTAFLTFSQESSKTIVLQEIEYVHLTSTSYGTSLSNFLDHNYDTLTGMIRSAISGRWQAQLEAPDIQVVNSIAGRHANPKFKVALPPRASKEKAYLFVQILTQEPMEANHCTPATWTFRFQLLQGDKSLVAKDDRTITVVQDGYGRPSQSRLTDADCIALLNTGLSNLFRPQGADAMVYAKNFPEQKQKLLKQQYPDFYKAPLEPPYSRLSYGRPGLVSSNFILHTQSKEAWLISPTDERFSYTRKNVGGDVVSGILTGMTGIGTSATRRLVFEDQLTLRNEILKETMTCRFFISGTRWKDKERTPNGDGTYSISSEFSFSKIPDATTHGVLSRDTVRFAHFQFVRPEEMAQLLKKVAPVDSVFATDLAHEEQVQYFDALKLGKSIGFTGNWNSDSFAIAYRLNGDLTQYLWNGEVIAFSLQNSYEPALYRLKNTNAPLSQMVVLQYELYHHLFRTFSPH